MSFLGDIADAFGIGSTGVPWGTVASAGSALLGFEGQENTNEQNLQIANATSAFNADQAQLNRDYQTEMSNTAWQRAVKDIKAAGLNPMLAYYQGGASSPNGSLATGVPATMQNSAAAATQAAQAAAQIDNIKADTLQKEASATLQTAQAATEYKRPANIEAETNRTLTSTKQIQEEIYRILEDTNLKGWQKQEIAQRMRQSMAEVKNIDQDTLNKQIMGMIHQLELPGKENEADFEASATGKARRYIDFGVGTAGKVLNSAGDAIRSIRRPK